jgi:DNA-binding XRE family transcriptional regulator
MKQYILTDDLQVLPMNDRRYGVQVPYLQEWREYRVLDQSELARRAKVHRATVIAGEQGKPLRHTTVGRLAKALDIDRHTLVYNRPEKEGPDHDE